MDVQALDQRLTMKYHLSKVRLCEFVWVGGHINVGWASGPNVLVSRGQGAVDVVGPVVPSGRASGCEGAQECTQIDENGPSELFWGTCVHCCDAKVTRANVGAQECTQIDENGPSGPFWDIRIIPTNESMLSTFRKTPLDVG